MSATTALRDAKRLLNLLYKVLSIKVPIGKDEAGVFDGLYFKLVAHAASAIRLAEGATPLPNGKASFTDVASVHALARAAYENALVLHYVFLVPESNVPKAERKLRLLGWRRAGFLEGRDWVPLLPEHQQRKREYSREAAKLRRRIRRSSVFKNLPPKAQKRMLEGEWREPWSRLADEMGIRPGHFKPDYAFLCAYAHSGAISAGQLSNMNTMPNNEGVRREMACIALSGLMVPLAKTILAFAARWPTARQALGQDADDVQFVETQASFADVDFTKRRRRAKP